MKKVSKKYLVYLIISIFIMVIWIFLSSQKFPLINSKVMLSLGTFFIFSFLVIFQIYTGIGHLIDLNVKDAREIWWSRVITLITISFIMSCIVVFRNIKIDNIIGIIINSAAFGILLGYWINKIDAKSKSREDGKQFIRNLQVEVSYNRRNCQAMLKDWAPLLLQTVVWDNLKLSKHFELLWQKENLTNVLSDLYLAVSSANFMISHAQLASFNIVHSPDETRAKISAKALEIMKKYIVVEVLPKLENMEKELADFHRTVVIKLSK